MKELANELGIAWQVPAGDITKTLQTGQLAFDWSGKLDIPHLWLACHAVV